jgi:hypothetical protein
LQEAPIYIIFQKLSIRELGFCNSDIRLRGEGGFFSRYSGTGFAGVEPAMKNYMVTQ